MKLTLMLSQTDNLQTMFDLPQPRNDLEEEISFWMHTQTWRDMGRPRILEVTIEVK